MNKEPILETAKQELVHMIESMNISTLNGDIKQIQAHINFLNALDNIEHVETQVDTPVKDKHEKKSHEELKQNKESKGSKKSKERKPDDSVSQEKGHLFERKLKGGMIEDLDVFVPERIIRELGLSHGDKVMATPINTDPTNASNVKASFKFRAPFGKLKPKSKPHYNFKLIKKDPKPNEDREEIKYCIVERDGSLWVCNTTLSGESIQFDEMPYTIRIKDSEVKDFDLSEGDIVDIAYSKSSPEISRVIWKHRIEDHETNSPRPSGVYKEKSPSETKIMMHPKLIGKTVTLIGCIDRHTTYQERLTAMGANFQGMDGKEDETRIASTIKRSDFVLIIIPAVSHQGSAVAKKYCKMYNIPFKAVDTIGTTAIAAEAVRMANELEMPVS